MEKRKRGAQAENQSASKKEKGGYVEREIRFSQRLDKDLCRRIDAYKEVKHMSEKEFLLYAIGLVLGQERIMQVDTTAMLQRIYDARDAKEISQELCSKLCERIMKVSETGSFDRPECDYEQLMGQLGLVLYDAEQNSGVE